MSDNLDANIVFIPKGSSNYFTSQFPSLDVVEKPQAVLQLAPVGPESKHPCVVAVSDELGFLYSLWQENLGLIDPAPAFSDWMDLDLGGRVLKVSSLFRMMTEYLPQA